MTEIRYVSLPDSPPPAGHYSPAVVHGDVVYVSGQLGRSAGMSDEALVEIDAVAALS